MQISISAPGKKLSDSQSTSIKGDLEKINRHLKDWDEVWLEVRVSDAQNGQGVPGDHVTMELSYGHHHLIAKAEDKNLGIAVRAAREELLRQIKDKSRGGHSSRTKHVPKKTDASADALRADNELA